MFETRGSLARLRHLHILRAMRLTSVGFAPLIAVFCFAADFHPPAGERYVSAGSAGAILPGGRIIRPLGTQLNTGARPQALAVGRNGTIATADTGQEQAGISVIEAPAKGVPWHDRHIYAVPPGVKTSEKAAAAWQNVANGIAFDESGKGIWISEGASGKLREIDQSSGDTRKTISLNGPDSPPGSSGELLADSMHHWLYAVDAANSRVAVVDVKAGRVVASVKTEPGPSALALSPDQTRLYVATAESVCAIDVHESVAAGRPRLHSCRLARRPDCYHRPDLRIGQKQRCHYGDFRGEFPRYRRDSAAHTRVRKAAGN